MPSLPTAQARALLLIIILLPATLTAEIYKWRDDKGRVHYGERPPADHAEAREISAALPPIHEIPAATAPKSAKRPSLQTKAVDRRETLAAQRALERQAQRCEKYADQLADIQRKLRAGYREPRGNKLRERRRVLEQKQHEECSGL